MYKCVVCGREVLIRSKGMCPYCRKKSKEEERKPVKKAVKENYSDFYASHIKRLLMLKTSVTGRPITYPSVCNVCHIFPKRMYKSVAKEDYNIIYLTQDEHTFMDKCLDEMDLIKLKEKMPEVYNIVLSRYEKIKDKIEEQGKLKNLFENEQRINK